MFCEGGKKKPLKQPKKEKKEMDEVRFHKIGLIVNSYPFSLDQPSDMEGTTLEYPAI